jgi:hypothetical protein
MAELEIIKHTKKAYKIYKTPNMGLKAKLTDILTEIVIIVFAVSISIWLSNWSERRHDRKEEKEFLLGFKKDLQSEISRIKNSKDFYLFALKGISYFIKVGNGAPLNKDSINIYSGIFFSSTDLYPHIGRYEGLKSSGKFKIIENKELLNNIIELQETIVERIQTLNDKYYQHAQRLEIFVEQNVRLAGNGSIINAGDVVRKNDLRILLSTSGGIISQNIISIHDEGIQKCEQIISEIDKELKINKELVIGKKTKE